MLLFSFFFYFKKIDKVQKMQTVRLMKILTLPNFLLVLFINKFSVLIIAKLSNITKSLYHQTKISLKQIVNFILK